MKRNLLVVAFVAAMFALLGIYVGTQHANETQPIPAIDALFSLSLPDDAGNPQHLSTWKGKTLLVNFWAPWCAPCVEEMPELSRLQTEMARQDIHIIGIGIDSPANIATFAAKYKIGYPLYVGGLGATETARQLGNKTGGLPFTVLINPDGTIRKSYLGRLNMEGLRKDLSLASSSKT